MKSLLSRWARQMDSISVFIGYACIVPYFACIALSVYEVVMRYALGAPTQWTFEVLMVLCATSWVLSSGLVTQRHRHIAITMLETIVSEKTWRLMTLIQQIAALLAIGVLIWATWHPAVEAFAMMERSGSAFNAPTPTYLKSALVVGAILYFLQLIANIVHWFDDCEVQGQD
ncbi:TRAP transporter small permease [uncultured Cohaesibacter sp.]|uniref:TRAP transporter small permease subunit n=1 Tax=uncultured Cohaesibacter sp. TaxID=1002546 RepID=UPI0029C8190F|nr:TRAP transporter small permease [uncultured Cohaesibacter sp.]